jgi:hypothetical protein
MKIGIVGYEGVSSFLKSRGIYLPHGDPVSPPNYKSIIGLGNTKNRMVKEAFRSGGVEVYHGNISFARHKRREGFNL